uniref:(California timema) hypothetical protein n=1 Tax=Timema californicum TaxID=61474 RepID=A0A7R9IXV0_TIMCA|nr:unnamed protein product [Timema californicum]
MPLDTLETPKVEFLTFSVIMAITYGVANYSTLGLAPLESECGGGEGVKYYANEPRMLGKTFLRLERDFDKHVAYCRDEPAAQELLQENEMVRDYFEVWIE